MAIWLRGGLRSFVESSLSEAAVNSVGVLAPSVTQQMLAAHHERRSLNDKQIFALLMFQRWAARSAASSSAGSHLAEVAAARRHSAP